MKQLTQRFTPFLIMLALMLPWATADALETFEKAGIISSVGPDQFTLDRKSYRLAPKAQLKSEDASHKKFSDFKKGDKVWFTGTILNNVHYVDMIVYVMPDDS